MSGDILDQIDGALEDWTVSADAMRWVPEEDRTERPPLPPPGDPLQLADGWIDAGYVSEDGLEFDSGSITQGFATFRQPLRIEATMQAIGRAFESVMESIRRLNDLTQGDFVLSAKRYHLHDWREGETVQERALRLRQNRNTGPAKPLPSYRGPAQPVRRHTRRNRTRGRRRG